MLAKIETFNPGNSIKDRMAVKMIEDAERAGLLKPGGTIIEGTSGNTGMGLAIAAVVKGYKCIFTTTDKQSKEKMDALRAFGAEVIVCPTDVDPEDPRSYYSVSSRLERKSPNAWKANQYDNLVEHAGALRADRPRDLGADRRARSLTSWSASAPAARSAASGRYLKERNPAIKVWGIDTYGSVFKKYKETGIFDKNEIYPVHHRRHRRGLPAAERRLLRHRSLREGDRPRRRDHDAADRARGGHLRGQLRGRRRWPACCSCTDRFKADDVVVVIFHDHGSRYLGKMFNDDWMREKGFLEKSGMTARDLVAIGLSGELCTIERSEPVARAVQLMTRTRLLADPGHRRRTARRRR